MATYLHELKHPKLLCLASPYDPRYQPTNFHWVLRFNPSGAKPALVYLSVGVILALNQINAKSMSHAKAENFEFLGIRTIHDRYYGRCFEIVIDNENENVNSINLEFKQFIFIWWFKGITRLSEDN